MVAEKAAAIAHSAYVAYSRIAYRIRAAHSVFAYRIRAARIGISLIVFGAAHSVFANVRALCSYNYS